MAAVTTTTPANYYHSPASSNNNSPTSHHQLPLQSRQLRPPKAPLYVPAALRPTERPPKQHNQHHQASPPTPPRSIHASSSLDSLNDSPTTPDTYEPITRRSTMESSHSGSVSAVVSKLAEDEWMKNESLGYVTGLPTKDHWKVSSLNPSSLNLKVTLANFHRPTRRLPIATPPLAAPRSVSSCEDTTAVTVVMSFAPRTPLTSSLSTKTPVFTRTVSPRAHVISAGMPTTDGRKPATSG